MDRGDVRVAAVVAATAAAAFVALAVLVATGSAPVLRVDRAVADGANEYAAAHPGWVLALKVWTNAAGPLVWRLVIVGVALLLVVRRALRPGAFAFTAIAVAGVLSTAVKVGVDRARPALPHPYANAAGMSFPSGHATTSAVACGVLLLLALPRLQGAARAGAWALAVAVPLSVGCTRIGLDVHWASDVVAGWLLGIAVVAAAYASVPPRVRSPLAPVGGSTRA